MKLYLSFVLLLPFAGMTQSLTTDPQLQQLYAASYSVQNELATHSSYFPDQQIIVQKKVKQLTCNYEKSGNRKKINEIRQYNEKGQLIHREHGRHSYTYLYADSLLVTSIHSFKHKSWSVHYAYDDAKRLTEILRTDSKGKPASIVKMTYFEQLKTSQISYTDLTGKTHVYVLEKEYDMLLRTLVKATYRADGVLKKTWNYSCDEKGVQVTPKTEVMSSRCEFQSENADGSYSKFIRSVEQGKSYLFQQDYSKDSVLTGLTRYLNDSIIVWRQRMTPNLYTYEQYSRKGKLRFSTETQKNDNGQATVMCGYNKRRKITYRNELVYTDASLLSEIHYTKSGSVLRYTYTFYPD